LALLVAKMSTNAEAFVGKDAGSASTRQSGGLTERSTGSVLIPQEAFIAALRMGEE
jgi:phage gpG-like protein